MSAVLAEYQSKLSRFEATRVRLRTKQTATALLLIGCLALLVVSGYLALAKHALPLWYPPLTIPVACFATITYARQDAARLRLSRLRDCYSRGVARLENRWAGQGEPGDEFAGNGHVYEYDFNLFGTGSLFELLCTTRTEIGRSRLAEYLKCAPQLGETAARQQAVQELRDRTELRERVITLGKTTSQQSSPAAFSKWLDDSPHRFPAWLRIAAAIGGVCAGTLFFAGFAGAISPGSMVRIAAPLLLVNSGVALSVRKRVKGVIERGLAVSVEIELIREGVELLAGEMFHSPKLQELAERVALGTPAAKQLRRLELPLRILVERSKDWFYYPSLLLLAGTQCAAAIESWRTRRGESLRDWLDAWAEFEALVALAWHASEHPDDPFPQLESNETVYEAYGLAHPLLPESTTIRNDVHLTHGTTRFFVISGSNMAGKSTLLRAIGLNAVLALTGAPVRARSLRLTRFTVAASISIVDSVQDGKSKFLAELDRLRAILRLSVENPPMLFLIDEIFSGTNSHDRRIAAESVFRVLAQAGALGAVSTHDLALTEIAVLDGLHGTNIHMGSRDGTDPLDFDYLIKPGVTQEANALAIARLAGVPV
jgi:hypothetical protein